MLAGALSLVLQRYAILAAALFGIMLFLFVLLLWVPAIVQDPGDRFGWALAFWDLAFGAGPLSFAAAQAPTRWIRPTKVVPTLARAVIGIAAIFFAVEHFLRPEFKPGVPLEQMTPPWFPGRVPLSHLTGVILLITVVRGLQQGDKAGSYRARGTPSAGPKRPTREHMARRVRADPAPSVGLRSKKTSRRWIRVFS